MMGLRVTDGIDLLRYENLAGKQLNTNSINMLGDYNLVSLQDNRLIATPQGRPVLNAIIKELLTE
jgi:oxygen-independent coproporphyrinogen-3 oxidase